MIIPADALAPSNSRVKGIMMTLPDYGIYSMLEPIEYLISGLVQFPNIPFFC